MSRQTLVIKSSFLPCNISHPLLLFWQQATHPDQQHDVQVLPDDTQQWFCVSVQQAVCSFQVVSVQTSEDGVEDQRVLGTLWHSGKASLDVWDVMIGSANSPLFFRKYPENKLMFKRSAEHIWKLFPCFLLECKELKLYGGQPPLPVAPGLGLGAPSKVFVHFQILRWKCPLQNENALALSKMKFQAWMQWETFQH